MYKVVNSGGIEIACIESVIVPKVGEKVILRNEVYNCDNVFHIVSSNEVIVYVSCDYALSPGCDITAQLTKFYGEGRNNNG